MTYTTTRGEQMEPTLSLDALIETLEELRAEHGGDAPVFIQHQRTYPLMASLLGITTDAEVARYELEERLGEEDEDFDTSEVDWPEPEQAAVYLIAKESTAYGNRAAWETARSAW